MRFPCDVYQELYNSSFIADMIFYRLKNKHVTSIHMFGDKRQLDHYAFHTNLKLSNLFCHEWNFDKDMCLDEISSKDLIVIARDANNASEWEVTSHIRTSAPCEVVSFKQLLLPFLQIKSAMSKYLYHFDTFDEVISRYLGFQDWALCKMVNNIYPIKDKTIIEFGPWEGYATATLVALGAGSINCIEGRSENVIKVNAAKHALGWDQVSVVMDDFHNSESRGLGKYDLAFCHGSYYHTIATMIFLDNLISLSDNIYMGGFCATDSLPDGDYRLLSYNDETFRAKRYMEGGNCLAGMFDHGYFLHKDDLIRFFRMNGFNITIMTEDQTCETAGCYIRFMAQR